MRNRATIAALSGTTGVVTVIAVAFAMGGGDERTAGRSAAVKPSSSRAKSPPPRVAASVRGGALDNSDDEPDAVAFYREKDPRDKVTKHVKEVRWSGPYLRVYTDLAEKDAGSKVALDLCKWTSEYLADRRGDQNPVVFVHAKKSDNGNVVLVSKLSAEDACRSVETL